MYSKLIAASLFAASLLASTTFAQTMHPGPPGPPPPPPRPYPVVETEPLSVGATCVQDGEDVPVLHYAKIWFTLDRGMLNPRDGRDGSRLNLLPREIPLTVIVRHDPTRVHDVAGRVLAFLRARADGMSNRAKLHILSTEFSSVCATPDDDDEPGPPHPPKPPRH
jgi:hypothetical protein